MLDEPLDIAIVDRLRELQENMDRFVTVKRYPSYAQLADAIEDGTFWEGRFLGV